VGPVADHHAPGVEQPAALHLPDLRQEHAGVEDHARPEEQPRPAMQRGRRNEVEDDLLPLDDEGVPGVGAASIADDGVGLGGQ
jgi:hypothetical protein